MPAKSLNLDLDVLRWLDRTARAEKKSASKIVNERLRVYMVGLPPHSAPKRRRA